MQVLKYLLLKKKLLCKTNGGKSFKKAKYNKLSKRKMCSGSINILQIPNRSVAAAWVNVTIVKA